LFFVNSSVSLLNFKVSLLPQTCSIAFSLIEKEGFLYCLICLRSWYLHLSTYLLFILCGFTVTSLVRLDCFSLSAVWNEEGKKGNVWRPFCNLVILSRTSTFFWR
jgi:hypothetical protein